MSRKVIISISPNGLIKSRVTGTKGRNCLEVLELLELLEKIIDGEIISQEFTEEYYQTADEQTEQIQSTEIKTKL